MVTPFTPAGAIDEPAIGRIVEQLVSARLAGIFPLGTTGESMSIHPEENAASSPRP
jgi:dihydrodipicolinate synthase/N-acetylneuraminate lyase